MVNVVLLVGVVVETWEERGAQYVSLRTGGGNSRGKDWEEIAVVRFYGETTKYTNGLARGQLVRIDASVKARKKQQGDGYFVDVEGRYLRAIEEVRPQVNSGGQHTRTSAKPRPADDSDTPF